MKRFDDWCERELAKALHEHRRQELATKINHDVNPKVSKGIPEKIYAVMGDGRERTVDDIALAIGCTKRASVSSALRKMVKDERLTSERLNYEYGSLSIFRIAPTQEQDQ